MPADSRPRLGNVETLPADGREPAEPSITVVPPSWRRDLSREIDLIEEVARIDGYEKIPEDVGVPMAPSARTREDRVLEKVRQVLTASGVDEAMTLSVVETVRRRGLQPVDRRRAAAEPDAGAARRRQAARQPGSQPAGRPATNEALANPTIELFEIAKVYLPQGDELPREERGCWASPAAGTTRRSRESSRPSSARSIRPCELEAEATSLPLLDAGRPLAGCDGTAQLLGYVGQVRPEGLKRFDLRGPATVAEVRLLARWSRRPSWCRGTPHCRPIRPLPAI